MSIVPSAFPGYDVSAGEVHYFMDPSGSPPIFHKEITEEQIEAIADDYAMQALMFKKIGFDMVSIHLSSSPRRFRHVSYLRSPIRERTNTAAAWRTGRRFPLMIFDRIRQACGEGFPLEGIMSAVEPEGGTTLEDTIAFAKMAEGYIDILQLRAGTIDAAHPTGFNPNPTPFIHFAEALKDSGARIVAETVGGYQDLDVCNDFIATGKTDLIAMARIWISDPDYGIKAYEGRNEDVVPASDATSARLTRSRVPSSAFAP